MSGTLLILSVIVGIAGPHQYHTGYRTRMASPLSTTTQKAAMERNIDIACILHICSRRWCWESGGNGEGNRILVWLIKPEALPNIVPSKMMHIHQRSQIMAVIIHRWWIVFRCDGGWEKLWHLRSKLIEESLNTRITFETWWYYFAETWV